LSSSAKARATPTVNSIVRTIHTMLFRAAVRNVSSLAMTLT
jgi:hypothetical protein